MTCGYVTDDTTGRLSTWHDVPLPHAARHIVERNVPEVSEPCHSVGDSDKRP